MDGLRVFLLPSSFSMEGNDLLLDCDSEGVVSVFETIHL